MSFSISSATSFTPSVTAVGLSVLDPLSLDHPYDIGSRSGGCDSSEFNHIIICRFALNMFYMKDSLVGAKEQRAGAAALLLPTLTVHIFCRASVSDLQLDCP